MKKTTIALILLLSCGISSHIFYSKAQAIDNTKIITQAIMQKDTPALIQELVDKIKNEMEIDEARYPSLIKEIEEYTASCNKPDEAAILHSLIAEMYAGFERSNSWKIRQRTPVTGYVPDDINEWTSNLFEEKIKEEHLLSLQPEEVLKQTPINRYAVLLETGKNEKLRPMLYDYLIYRVLEVAPNDELYKKLIEYKKEGNNPEALMLAELDYAVYKFRNDNRADAQEKYLAELDSLYKAYSSHDFAAEICINRLDAMEMAYHTLNAGRDSLTQEIIALCEQTIAAHPNYERIGVLKNRLATLLNPTLEVAMPIVLYPENEVKLNLNYKNVKSVDIKVYALDCNPEDINTTDYWYNRKKEDEKTNRRFVSQIQFALDSPNTYQQLDTVLTINSPAKYGIYEYEVSVAETKITSSCYTFVSKMATLSRLTADDGAEFLVTDIKTGKPMANTTVLLYKFIKQQVQLVDSVETDANGIAKIDKKENNDIRYFRAVSKDDKFTPMATIYMGYRFRGTNEVGEDNETVTLFTDRGLYRPGQPVYFKGIAYRNQGENANVLPDKNYKVVLRDANHKEVSVREVKTNEFGSFAGEFTLPTQGLNGTYTISTENTTTSIRVEEYKRPSFRIEFNPIKDEVTFGDTVKIEGEAKTYSGVALQDGKVNYRILLRPLRIYHYGIPFDETQELYGETVLDDEGRFSFSFVPDNKKQPYQRGVFPPYVSYEVIVSVSDSKGETQEANTGFSVGSTSIVLSTTLLSQMKNENLSVSVSAQTLNGEKVQTKGRYAIYALLQKRTEGKQQVVKEQGDLVGQGQFTTDQPIPSTVFSKLPSGSYRIKFEAVDSKNRPVELEQDVVLYTDKDKRPPIFSDIWLPTTDITVQPGENATFVFGTSHKKAYVLYELQSAGKVVMRKRMELTDENKKLTIPFLSSYGDGAVALFTFIKDGKLHTNQVTLNKKEPDRKLRIKTETFRDKLMPGYKETWTLKVLTPDSLPATAEVLASMYDASLDAIESFNWYLSVWNRTYYPATSFRNNTYLSTSTFYLAGDVKYQNVPEFIYSRFNWDEAMLTSYSYGTRSSNGLLLKSAVPESGMIMAESIVADEVSEVGFVREQSAEASQLEGDKKESTLRKNFNETAFFYPVLRTDKDGRFVVSFTLPESNTTWKFQTIAHTKDMNYGLLEKEVISSKPLMVQPNMPRFVREGDEVTISAQVINRSDDSIEGRVRLELSDPATDAPIVCLTKSQYAFDLAAGKQTTVSWTVPVPAGKDVVGVRVLADSETVSDGEQHLLPVLTNQVLITESTPFYLLDEGVKEITSAGTKKPTFKPYRQTLEISANPIWYAVQALPTFTRPSNNSVSAWFASYYGNVLASNLVNSHPRLRAIIDQWAVSGKDAASLISNLEKNEELKNIVLEETPWVLEAANETEQIQRLQTLFDLNRAEGQRAQALQELKRLQREDGAWGWFGGFGADKYITTAILQGMANLVQLNAVEYGQVEKEMQMNALRFLDREIVKEFESLKKWNKDWKNALPTEWQLDYVFMRSLYRDIPEMNETREAIRFFTGQAEKRWEKLPLRMRVQTALILHRNGKKENAVKIMNWFKRTATKSEEQGLYWANNRRNGFSPISPIETHTLLMSAFTEIAIQDMDVDRMKQWLLNQKRTQNWETTPATMNAVYVLLLTGGDWLAEDNWIIVDWGGELIDTKEGTTGIGYSKTTRSPEAGKSTNKIRIEKEGDTPAWGALYDQYLAPMDEVEQASGELSVDKKLFLKKASDKGVQLVALQEGDRLKVGDKAVVRLTIRTKQEMTYVHLKDMRAGCFEPVDQLSGTIYRDGVFYYRTSKDASEQFFFDRLPVGTFVLEYEVFISRTGDYSAGPATIQCLYAPEYVSHTAGGRIIIKD